MNTSRLTRNVEYSSYSEQRTSFISSTTRTNNSGYKGKVNPVRFACKVMREMKEEDNDKLAMKYPQLKIILATQFLALKIDKLRSIKLQSTFNILEKQQHNQLQESDIGIEKQLSNEQNYLIIAGIAKLQEIYRNKMYVAFQKINEEECVQRRLSVISSQLEEKSLDTFSRMGMDQGTDFFEYEEYSEEEKETLALKYAGLVSIFSILRNKAFKIFYQGFLDISKLKESQIDESDRRMNSSEKILLLHSYSSLSNQLYSEDNSKVNNLIRKVTSQNHSPAVLSGNISQSQNINLFKLISNKIKQNLSDGFRQIKQCKVSIQLENQKVSVQLQKKQSILLKNKESLQLDPFNSNYFKPSKVMKGHHSKNSSNNSDKLKEIVQQIYQGKEIDQHFYRSSLDKQSIQSQQISNDQISIKLLKFDNFLKGGKQSSLLLQQFMESSQDSKALKQGIKRFGSESLYENHLVHQRNVTVQSAVNDYLKTNKSKIAVNGKKAKEQIKDSKQKRKIQFQCQKNINRKMYELLIVVIIHVVFGVLLFKYFQEKHQ